MKIFNLGSINADFFYRLPHLPQPGETLASVGYDRGLGGKGANQSVACARAGAQIRHIGAIGAEGRWMVERMEEAGVDCSQVVIVREASGHAIIYVDQAGENSIVLHPGANRTIPETALDEALDQAEDGDLMILQNETGLQVEAAQLAAERGLFVIYSAAPFDEAAVRAVLPYVSLLIVNEGEARALCASFGLSLQELPVKQIVVTKGAQGATWHNLETGGLIVMPAFPVTPVDTTGAGDTFAGYLAAALAEGCTRERAMRLASAASALKVTRAGTADAIPTRADVEDFLDNQPKL
ncbi:ribokinase [Thioclava sp. GXIMD4216]|uniref:Ribokinase n=1 Tax=Thioclava litoralis TaxID=3076557 RepID=A0ABZ1E188_9RHOB|nr:ribokinase [Thioclava sp. FTW29]